MRHLSKLIFGTVLLLFTLAVMAADTTKDKQVSCPQCVGTGTVKCAITNCVEGKIDCPGVCLRLNKGVWKKMEVKGHAGNRVWQEFKRANGTWAAWNDHHLGEVIAYENGNPVLKGKCPVCTGTTQVACTACKGAGETTCSLCQGNRTLLESELAKKAAPATSPFFQAAPTAPAPPKPQFRFELKDGRVLIGRKAIVIGNAVTIRTEKGDVEVNAKDIVKEEAQPVAK
jgi:hypothetical protein